MKNLKDPSQRGALNAILGGVLWVLTPIETFSNACGLAIDKYLNKAQKDPNAWPKVMLLAVAVIVIGMGMMYLSAPPV